MLKDVHTYWLIAILLMGAIAIRQMWRGYRRQMDWQAVDQNIGSYFVTVVDLEILLGIMLWVIQGRWDGLDMSRTMSHPTLMLVAWGAIRFGWFQVQQSTISESKFLRATIYFLIGIAIMALGTAQVFELV